MDQRQEREIARGLQQGKIDAWHALYDAYARPVWESVARLMGPGSADVADVVQETSPSSQVPQRRRRVITLAIRSLAAAGAAAAVLIGTWLWNSAAPEGAPALGRVLEKTASADTLQLQVTRDGKTAGVWARRPGQLRVNEPDGTYRIAREGRLWLVDEKANRATSQPSPLFAAGLTASGLLSLLELPLEKDYAALLEMKPAERLQRDGLTCDLYRWRTEREGGGYQVEALVDAGTEFLHSLEVKRERDGRAEPLGKLTVVALNQPVDERLFVVGDTLTEDGRIGKIADAQGVVSLKPAMAQRWTPVSGSMLLKPGDWLQTDLRGANAVALRLVKQTAVTLGPGTLVELVRPNQIRIADGELKVVAAPKAPIDLLGPGQQKVAVEGTQIYRVQKEKLVRVEKDPLWLRGFEGRTNNESIGSLVAKIDGRNVPLSVGYHKVSVDIRDQIARTVIEESFVNHTSGTLEGVFHFPLPQDASIAGFGMWIGDTLVEADVVEKQRAREIYETILRERRDPGLLEWSGGNIFKARVFPIFGNSEKRITITYTQVLPVRGNRYRYQYALQSEMLRQHPLRELAIDVKLNSAVPLASVTSPTHTTRIQTSGHSAHVEFAAQEYTPTRDFEVVVEVAGRQSEVVLIPHRRGDDGYFMVQLTPPAGAGSREREVLPDGEPLDLLILADTSASMDAAARAVQAELIASLLAALTTRDALNLATCDVDCRWVFDKPRPAEAKTVAAARQFLSGRISLGWTDLDKAFASALKQCGPRTQVIYIGDGIVTADNVPTTVGQDSILPKGRLAACPTSGDPVAFVKRLRRLAEGKPGTFHAVAVGSSFEPGVMKGIASLGGGSFRQVSGEHGPQAVALELLGEITRPAFRGLKVEFRGLRTARVYPEELPNLPAGTQQILLGRYLPEGREQVGEIVVTGTQAGKPVRFASRVSLAHTEQGNSFIPRLWARMHLDALLQQGASQAIQDEIIALSEEYHIMTPYTSLLVLESDADRERFKVKRRFLMRDGEKFFAQGRDNANWELVQQQMRRAGNWRIGLRRAVLQQLGTLARPAGIASAGRYARPVAQSLGTPAIEYVDFDSDLGAMGGFAGMGGGFGGGGRGHFLISDGSSDSTLMYTENAIDPFNAPMPTTPAPESLGQPLGEFREDALNLEIAQQSAPGDEKYLGGDREEEAREKSAGAWDQEQSPEGLSYVWHASPAAGLMPAAEPMSRGSGQAGAWFNDFAAAGARPAGGRLGFGMLQYESSGWERPSRRAPGWLSTLFPSPPPVPPKARERKTAWPGAARDLARRLLRNEPLVSVKEGLRFDRQVETFDAQRSTLSGRGQTLALVSPAGWLVRAASEGSQTTVTWCDPRECGSFSKVFQLGRLRASTPEDLRRPPIQIGDHTSEALDQTYADWPVEVKPQADGRALLVVTRPGEDRYEMRFLIDTSRRVILRIEHATEGKVHTTTTFGEFFQTAGVWWPGRIESLDEQGRRTSLVTQRLAPLAAGQLDRLWKEELAGRDQVQLLREPLPRLVDAKRAIAGGKATLDDHLTLLLYFQATQQWSRVLEHLDQAERLAPGKPGLRWVRSAVLDASRQREEVKRRYLEEAARLAKAQAAGVEGADESYLANYLVGQSAGVLESNEMLALLDVLRPVYARQPAYREAMKRWTERRADYLQNAGQTQDALRLRKQLAEQYPYDYTVQRHYVDALTREGEYEAAFAWLSRVLGRESRLSPNAADSLRNTYAESLRSLGRYPALVDFLAAWLKQDPQSAWASQQYLSALVMADRVDEANKLIAQWLNEGRREGRLSQEQTLRFQAAVSHALGQGYNLYSDRIEERWLEPLADLALLLAERDSQGQVADEIMNHWRFQPTDECRRVRVAAAKILRAGVDKLSPAQIERFVNWMSPNDPAVEKEAWRQIAAGLRKRWDAATKDSAKNQLGQTLSQVLSQHAPAAEWLAFLRVQLDQGPQRFRTSYAGQLFDALLGQPWSAEHESEAFALVARLTDAEDPVQRLAVQVAALHRVTDRMVHARFDARMKTIEHQEKLTRTELRAKSQEHLRQARTAFADRLRQEMAKHPAALARWINVERLYLDVLLERNLDQVEAECWEYLGPEPVAASADDPAQALEAALRDRLLVTLLNLAARKGAAKKGTGSEPVPRGADKAGSREVPVPLFAGVADRLLAYLDRAAKADPEDVRWKLYQYQLLVALDRPKDLQARLEAWIASGDPDNRWRVSLGYLLAEQGKIDPAIKLFEAVQAADELRPSDWRALADWHVVAGRRDLHDRAMISVYKTVDEWRLSNWISQKLQPWQQSDRPPPRELDKEVLLVFAALFEKASNPQNHLGQLQQFYQTTRDFRLLAGLADGVAGHSAGQIYPFLQGMTPVLSEVRDEATADSIVERLAEVRKRAKTEIDQRALDLLEALVERRAAEVLNQPGPHVDRALAALQRSWKRQWSPGEPRLVADLLSGLGAISQPKLAEEQIRQLEELHRQAARGSIDRLHIAHAAARAYWSYSRHDAAIDLLQAALEEHQSAMEGVLPAAANPPLDTLISCLESRVHHARGEKALQDQLRHPANQQQVYWLRQRLYQLYQSAIERGGDVSLGAGVELYRTVHRKLQAELDTPDQNYRYALVHRLCGIYRTAHDRKLAGAVDDLRQFAFRRLPEVMKRQTNNYESVVSQVAQTLHDLAGPRDGLAFLLTQIETEPGWLRYNNQDGWSRHSGTLARWREEAKDLGDLEERLLRIVVAELRKDLRSGQQRNRAMYYRHYGNFWAAKESVFAQTAEEVLAERKQSGATMAYIAEYLFEGMGRRSRAIEILLDAHRRELLNEAAQSRLVSFLHQENRYGESIAILEPLVERRPDNLQYRVWLMHAYFHAKQPQQLLALLKKTDAFFHQGNRWQEQAIAGLAQACLDTQLYQQSVDYYNEVIPLHQRTQPRRGIGNGTLSLYYRSLAHAYAGLKKTAEAVDAACGAIVSWGNRWRERHDALESLKQVIRGAPDLDGYVAQVDRQGAETGLQNPIVRKAIGQVYLEKRAYAKAIRQLELAVEIQPNDAETHQALVACCDQQGDKDGAIRRLLQWRELARRDIKLYEDLAKRYETLEKREEAERAQTSIVEVLPSESESHALLAEIRQQQNRWPEAIAQWEQVARIRALEPTGLLKLAAAQIHERQWEPAETTLRKLETTAWPSRFGGVPDEARSLRQQMEEARSPQRKTQIPLRRKARDR